MLTPTRDLIVDMWFYAEYTSLDGDDAKYRWTVRIRTRKKGEFELSRSDLIYLSSPRLSKLVISVEDLSPKNLSRSLSCLASSEDCKRKSEIEYRKKAVCKK